MGATLRAHSPYYECAPASIGRQLDASTALALDVASAFPFQEDRLAMDIIRITLRLDDEDRRMLDRLCAIEKLSKVEIVRRGLRAYARALGVEQRSRKSSTPVDQSTRHVA